MLSPNPLPTLVYRTVSTERERTEGFTVMETDRMGGECNGPKAREDEGIGLLWDCIEEFEAVGR